MTADRKIVINLRAQAQVWRIPPRVEQQIVDGVPSGCRVQVVTTDTVSDGDGGHPPTPQALDAISDADVYYGFGITPQLFHTAKKLRWVHTATAGVGSLLFPELVASELTLTNSAGVHAIPMAEYVVGGLLHFWRGFDFTQTYQQQATWERGVFVSQETLAREVGESSVLIIGTGGIGREVATRLTALGATCIGIRRHPDAEKPEGFARVERLEMLDTLLATTDALILAAPLTPLTRGLITAQRLDMLPPHAVVVNVARGAIVDQDALMQRLASGRLRGAALDVFNEEPLAADSPLWQLRRALITPHISAVTPRRFWERQASLFLENCRRYADGQPLLNVVNKDAGY